MTPILHWCKSLWALCTVGLAAWTLLAEAAPSLFAQAVNTDSLKTLLQSSKDTLVQKIHPPFCQAYCWRTFNRAGLSIVKKMAEVMKGRVWCESEYGHGATFIVELPAHV